MLFYSYQIIFPLFSNYNLPINTNKPLSKVFLVANHKFLLLFAQQNDYIFYCVLEVISGNIFIFL